MQPFHTQLDLFPREIDPFLIKMIEYIRILDSNEATPQRYNSILREARGYATEAQGLGSAKAHFHLRYLDHYEFRPETAPEKIGTNQLSIL